MATVTALFTAVTGVFTGGNDQALLSLNAATNNVGVVLRVENILPVPIIDNVSLYYVTSPDLIGALTIPQLKAKFGGLVKEIQLPVPAVQGFFHRRSFAEPVNGLFFAAWLETTQIGSLKLSAWAVETT